MHKPVNLRQAGGKKRRPKGHNGHTLRFSANPDEVIVHPLTACSHCASPILQLTQSTVQVFDLPAPSIRVTEHRVQKACCSSCISNGPPPFSDRKHLPSTAMALRPGRHTHAYQMLPEQIAALLEDLTSLRPAKEPCVVCSAACVGNWNSPNRIFERSCSKNRSFTQMRRDSGWVRSCAGYTRYPRQIHLARHSQSPRRQAIDELGQLPFYLGTVVHDCWASYFKEGLSLRPCSAMRISCENAKASPNLTSIGGRQEWASSFRNFGRFSRGIPQKGCRSPEIIDAIRASYDREYRSLGHDEWSTSKTKAPGTEAQPKKKAEAEEAHFRRL